MGSPDAFRRLAGEAPRDWLQDGPGALFGSKRCSNEGHGSRAETGCPGELSSDGFAFTSDDQQVRGAVDPVQALLCCQAQPRRPLPLRRDRLVRARRPARGKPTTNSAASWGRERGLQSRKDFDCGKAYPNVRTEAKATAVQVSRSSALSSSIATRPASPCFSMTAWSAADSTTRSISFTT
jgi:hypothetical protein